MIMSNNKDDKAEKMAATLSKNKTLQLNRFLSKTFHMISRSDSAVASWAPSGDSFVVHDVEQFSETILPLYFKHRKFASFVRQLNFYGFRKVRSELEIMNEEEGRAAPVNFFHEHFKRDHPELLHRIHRATKNIEVLAPGVEALQIELDALKRQLSSVSDDMEQRMVKWKEQMEADYNRRLTKLENGYQDLSVAVTPRRESSLNSLQLLQQQGGSSIPSQASLSEGAAVSRTTVPISASLYAHLLGPGTAASNSMLAYHAAAAQSSLLVDGYPTHATLTDTRMNNLIGAGGRHHHLEGGQMSPTMAVRAAAMSRAEFLRSHMAPRSSALSSLLKGGLR